MSFKRHVILSAILALVMVSAQGAAPRAAGASALTAAIQRQYDTLQSFKATFVQVLVNAATKEQETRTGHIYFTQPSLIRWETDTPESELVVIGKDAVWNWFPADAVAIKYATDEVLSSRTMIRFISGKANLSEDFTVYEKGVEDGLTRLDLTPKDPEPSIVQATVWIDPKSDLIRRVELVDFYGNVNRVDLTELALNPALDSALFTFTPPAGAEIQDNTRQGS